MLAGGLQLTVREEGEEMMTDSGPERGGYTEKVL